VSLRTLRSAPLALGYWLGIAGAGERRTPCGRVLMIHGTPRWHAAEFERAMRYVRRQFEVVPLAALADELQSSRPQLGGKLAITFDDGLRNNISVAYPILQRLGLPATFFVCPALLERGSWLWNQEARQRLRRLQRGALAELAQEAGAPADVEGFVDWMKKQDRAGRQRVEERIRHATREFSATADEHHEFDLARWDELARLDPEVVTIGSHTLTHPILTTLAPEELRQEVEESRRVLEAVLQRTVDQFAYPNGDVDATVHACVRATYRSAVSVEEGLVAAGCDRHMIPRINLPWNVLRLALALHRAGSVALPDYLRDTPISLSGSQVASSGNAVMSAMQSTIMKKNGSDASAT
jgi:peptidoglycan/xylan/chitin deacetylase (PgdA/CDA1 family)